MSMATFLKRSPAAPAIATSVYGGLLLTLMAATVMPIKAVIDQRMTAETLKDTLHLLDAHVSAAQHPDGNKTADVAATAFLEGSTVTVAGAALLQRLADAITAHGGVVSSSQLDMQSAHAKDGRIGAIASFEVGQSDLQQILYDLEAGMPFLFVDDLVVETSSAAATAGERFRVLMTLSGQWQGAR